MLYWPPYFHGKDIYVDINSPGPVYDGISWETAFPTIQAGIGSAAEPGDVVLIADGTYYGVVNFFGKAITVKSVNGSRGVIIDGSKMEFNDGAVVQITEVPEPGAVLEGVTVSNNLPSSPNSPGNGGILISKSNVTVINCDIANNGSQGSGGGMWIMDSVIDISQCAIRNNSALYGGGGIMLYNTTGTIRDSVISGNSEMHRQGGGIVLYSSPVTISNCQITGNSADGVGGGIFALLSDFVLENSFISRNFSNGARGMAGGSGLDAANCDNPRVTNCEFSYNSGGYSGGGIFLHATGGILSNNRIIGNSVSSGGAGMWIQYNPIFGNPPEIVNTIFADNKAETGNGGGIHFQTNVTPSITNCVFTGNSAPRGSGGALSGTTVATITNSIFWKNSALFDKELSVNASLVDVSYSNVQGGFQGTGNIDADPLFALISSDLYALGSNSPCIDTGTLVNAPEADILGTTRPQGLNVDMGAYEYIPQDLDGDGHLDHEDCDDSNPSVYPGAVETCDSIDNNCNSLIDEGFDNDADGFLTCTGDCNDTNNAIYPGAAEVKHDGIDQDCNGYDMTIEIIAVDYNPGTDNLSVKATSSYKEAAGLVLNGYGPMTYNPRRAEWSRKEKPAGGDPGMVTVCGIEGCELASTGGVSCTDNDRDGFAVSGGACGAIDCDDTDNAVNPEAQEICDNLKDDDCDGLIDSADSDCQIVDCSIYNDRNFCRANQACTWVNRTGKCIAK